MLSRPEVIYHVDNNNDLLLSILYRTTPENSNASLYYDK